MKNLLAGCALAALATSAVYAQETSSSITGAVTSGGAPVVGATVKVTHVPSGTVSTTVSRNDGSFNAPGLRVGGPYTVEIHAGGFATFSVTDIQTSVGQPFSLPVELEKSGQEIVVTAAKVRGARTLSEGPATVLTANDISKVASVNRDIRDLMRRDPFANLDTSQGTTSRQVSFAGVNPRFNRFTIDGVPITDSFGLNPDALPSRRGPVPLDSIGQFETKVAPYDIREGFFQGGVVNAILKSGTNQFHGTGFYTYNSDNLTGDRTKPYLTSTSPTNATGDLPQPHFTSKDFGATLSGPIIKDKLFFMISAERVRASLPLYTSSAAIPITSVSQAAFDQISAIAQNTYGVNPGGILSLNGDKDDRIVGKIDANLSSTQRLSFTGIYTKDQINTLGVNNSTNLATVSNDYVKPNRVLGGVAQLNSDWSSLVSTELRVRYKDYKSGQNPFNPGIAYAVVCTDPGTAAAIVVGAATACSANTGAVQIGPPGSASANVLRVKTWGGSLVTRFSFGDHTVRLLTEYEDAKNYNLFLATTISPVPGSSGPYGAYYFDSIAAFQARVAQGFGLSNATTLNQNDAAARFNYQTYTLGLQDDWRVNSQLHVSAGLRYDLYGGNTFPIYNPNFVAREGFSNQQYINGRQLLQPRVGFDYSPVRRLSIHGGAGIFGGGTPDVYVGNSFSASGIQPASLSGGQCPAGLTNVSLTSVPAACSALLASPPVNSSVSATSPSFKIPSQWRGTLSASYDANLGPLGDHWIFSANGLYSKVRNALLYRDGRDRPIIGTSALTPDGRQRYFDIVCNNNVTTCTVAGAAETGGDYILGNTHKGRTIIGVARFDKRWDFGLSVGGSFTYQDARDQQALTSSVAASNYNNGAYLDANGGAYGHTNDEVKYQFKYNVSFEHSFYKDYKTRLDLFGETRIGSPYSYTFRDPGAGRSPVFGTIGSTNHYLFYVPTGAADPKAVYADAATAAVVENLINTTQLSKYRGQIAPRNAFHAPWFTRIDLHLEQEIPTFVGHSRISLFADIENFTNLLNHKWGQQLRTSFPYNKQVVDVACVAAGTNTCDHYLYSNPTSDTTRADQLIALPSLYSIRIGARFTF